MELLHRDRNLVKGKETQKYEAKSFMTIFNELNKRILP